MDMKQSQLFTKTRKEAPADEVAKNAQLLIRAGYIHKEMAGVYSMLPLGLKVMEKIIGIIRKEVVGIGGQELFMTSLQSKEVWETTNRWSDDVVDNWFKTHLKNDSSVGLAFTHEEPLTALMKEYVSSYRDLPFSVFQFQTKFRNEARAKSGIMRTREFIMKDQYSFSRTVAEHDEFYEQAKQAYIRIFEKIGLGDKTYLTFASGGSFSKYSHEFQTLTDAGEDTIFVHEKKKIAINKEVMTPEVLADLGVKESDLVEKSAVEVGNIFSLGTKFSDAFDLTYNDEAGEKQKVIMGSYGIGPARLMGTIVEALSDDKGIVWPASVSPFDAHLIYISGKDESVKKRADEMYEAMQKINVSTLYDDRDARAGEKFADADLIGIPWQIIVSERGLADNKIEIKKRATGETHHIATEDFLSGTWASLFS